MPNDQEAAALRDNRTNLAVRFETRQIARVLASQWGITMADAVDRCLARSYTEEFGREPAFKAPSQ